MPPPPPPPARAPAQPQRADPVPPQPSAPGPARGRDGPPPAPLSWRRRRQLTRVPRSRQQRSGVAGGSGVPGPQGAAGRGRGPLAAGVWPTPPAEEGWGRRRLCLRLPPAPSLDRPVLRGHPRPLRPPPRAPGARPPPGSSPGSRAARPRRLVSRGRQTPGPPPRPAPAALSPSAAPRGRPGTRGPASPGFPPRSARASGSGGRFAVSRVPEPPAPGSPSRPRAGSYRKAKTTRSAHARRGKRKRRKGGGGARRREGGSRERSAEGACAEGWRPPPPGRPGLVRLGLRRRAPSGYPGGRRGPRVLLLGNPGSEAAECTPWAVFSR